MGRLLTLDRLRQVLEYDTTTGIFTWRETLSRRRLAGAVAGSVASTGYIIISIDGRRYVAHQLAWFYVNGEWAGCRLDHEDHTRSNNRLANLRPATNSQNLANRPAQSNNSSGFKGVSWNKGANRWRAQIKVSGSRLHLGYFSSAEDAHQAYVNAARTHFGEFARA